MSQPLVSVVMTTYRRPEQLYNTLQSIQEQQVPELEVIVVDDGDDLGTIHVCKYEHHLKPLRYIRTNRPHDMAYLNSGPVANTGLRAARGEWIILQNSECKHIGPVIQGLLDRAMPHGLGQKAVFARVVALDEQGRETIEYCGPSNPRPYFFCGLMARAHFLDLGGFDEDFTRYGYEDDDFADRLRRIGVTFEFTDLLVHHQWHPSAGSGGEDMSAMAALYERKKLEGVVRNVGREWGRL